MYLVDTDVVSSAAPSRRPPAELAQWMEAHSSALYLSAVSIAEVAAGIAKTRRERAMRKARDLSAWLDALVHLYSERVLPLDVAVARIAGGLIDQARAKGRPVGFADLLIAATAKRHDLTVLTRNLKHFRALGVRAFDPFLALPS